MTRTSVRDKMIAERRMCMKEIMKSKIMLGFIIFVLGFTYLDSLKVKRLEQEMTKDMHELVVMNMN